MEKQFKVQTLFLITKRTFKKMVAHCSNQLPLEGCGLLSGRKGIAESIWPMDNIDLSPTSYTMDLEQINKVFDMIHNRGEELVGIYHSHPTAEAYPSLKDIAYNNYPEVAHLIISFARSTSQPDVNGFKLNRTEVTPLNIEKIK